MEISVIVPFYNAAPSIGRCIEGLLAQDLPADRYEILFVDNNSTDASADIVAQHPRVRLLTEPKQGAYAARNRGIAAAQGRLLAFTDPDCVPGPDWLRRLTAPMATPETQIVVGGYQAPASRLAALLDRYEETRNAYLFGRSDGAGYFGYTNNMAVRRSLFDRLGPFDERPRGADTLLVRRAVQILSADVVRYEPAARVRHLEVEDVARLFRKKFLYGASSHAHRRDGVGDRPLSFAEKIRLLRQTVRDARFPRATAATLLLLLTAGWASYTVGRLYAALVPAPHDRERARLRREGP